MAPEVITSTFFNFAQWVATKGIPECWDRASPEEIGAARDRAVARALGRLTAGADLPDLRTVADHMRRAVEVCRPEGRPLFAAVAAAPWPADDPLVEVWHGANRLREYRGDGHIALLTAAGIGAVEALVLHAGTGEVPKSALLQTRGWSENDWQEGCARLQERGLVKGEELTDEGRAFRSELEDRTDAIAVAPWTALEEETESLRAAVRELSRTVADAGGVPGRIGRRAAEEG